MRSNGSHAPLVGAPPFDSDATIASMRTNFERHLATSLAMGQPLNMMFADWLLMQLVQEQRSTNILLNNLGKALGEIQLLLIAPLNQERRAEAQEALAAFRRINAPQKDTPNGQA